MASRRTRADLTDDIAQEMQVVIANSVLTNERIARELGLNVVDLQTLGVIMRMQEPVTPGAVSTATWMPSSTTTRVLDRLESKGFIERVSAPGDRRKVHVRPIPAALAALENPYAEILEDLVAFNQGFTVAELEVVLRYLTGMRDVPRNAPGSAAPGDVGA